MVCKPSQVTFNLDGGEGGPASGMYAHLSQVPLTPLPTKTGYTFQGWATTEGGEVVYDTNTTTLVVQLQDINLYAIWTPRTDIPYIVEHYQMDTTGNYPSTPTASQTFTGTTDDELTLADFAQTYAELPYSYGQVNGATATTTTIAPDGSRVIKLYYTRNKYRFTLGTHAGVNTTGSSPTGDYYYGATVTLKGTLNTGYTGNITWTSSNTGLVGNKTTTSGSATTFTMPNRAVTMTPSANLITYTVTYNANGGSGAPVAQTKYYGQTLTLSSVKPTRSGYTFVNWTGSDGKTYAPGSSYSTNANLTLSASWNAKTTFWNAVTAANYGNRVSYTSSGVSDWILINKNDNGVFLMSADIVSTDKLRFPGNVTAVDERFVRATVYHVLDDWLLDTSYWTQFANGTGGDVAWGGRNEEWLYDACRAWNAAWNLKYSSNAIRGACWNEMFGSTARYWTTTEAYYGNGKYWFYFVKYDGTVAQKFDTAEEGAGLRPIVRITKTVYGTFKNQKWELSY